MPAHPAERDGAGEQHAGQVRCERVGAVEQFDGGVEMPVRLLHARPAEQGLQHRRPGDVGLPVQRAGLLHAALGFEVPGEVGEHDRVARLRQSYDLQVMIFANLRLAALGEHHAHQVVRLRRFRRDADGVAGMIFRLVEAALGKQKKRNLVDRPEVVGVERDQPADQRLRGGRRAGGAAHLEQHGERRGLARGEFQHVERQPFGDLLRALAQRLRRALDQRRQVADRLRRPQRARRHLAATDPPQAAAART